jgi:hypothetical protein
MFTIITEANAQATTEPRPASCKQQMLGRWAYALRSRLGAAARAHERRRMFESVGEDVVRDTRVPPDTATGLSGWEPDLPFFMQSGFGRR